MGWDAESISQHLHRLAEVDDDDPIGPMALARRLGLDVFRGLRRGQRGDGWVKEGAIIVAHRLSIEDLNFAVAHELAEWTIGERQDEETEALCDRAAAAIIAPRSAFLGWRSEVGDDIRALAAAFRTTETCIAMRLGEVTGQPVAVVAPGHLHVRGEAWEWGDVRRVAIHGARGVDVVRLTDDPRRVALFAA